MFCFLGPKPSKMITNFAFFYSSSWGQFKIWSGIRVNLQQSTLPLSCHPTLTHWLNLGAFSRRPLFCVDYRRLDPYYLDIQCFLCLPPDLWANRLLGQIFFLQFSSCSMVLSCSLFQGIKKRFFVLGCRTFKQTYFFQTQGNERLCEETGKVLYMD